ncbi:MAG TPA: inorganic diphosphatase [Longimicrobiaceae bacterium]|nr:inorganic diphosphatase [Longimicrobiaceae bacterium]
MIFHPWHDLEAGTRPPDVMNVVVEIPRGSRNKYELDKKTGMFRLDRLLYSSVHYPGEYGFFPQTFAEDDDPLDALVMSTVPTFPGCVIEVRPVGIFHMTDKGEPDEKVLCVPARDPLYQEYEGIGSVAPHYLKEVEHFFAVYKDLEGVRVHPVGWEDRAEARTAILAAMARYQVKRQQEAVARLAQSVQARTGLEL